MRYQVPEGMLKAAWAAHETLRDNQGVNREQFERCLAAALEWLALNPIVPTEEQAEAAYRYVFSTELLDPNDKFKTIPFWVFAGVVAEWQRRMFLAPEESVPPQIEAAIRANTFTRQQAEKIIALVNSCVE